MNVDNNIVNNKDELWKYCNKIGSLRSLIMEKVVNKFMF